MCWVNTGLSLLGNLQDSETLQNLKHFVIDHLSSHHQCEMQLILSAVGRFLFLVH